MAHGVDPLDDIVAQAVAMRFHTYCLTEHMPRVNSKYLYPEERQEDMSPDPNIVEIRIYRITLYITNVVLKCIHKH